MEYGFSQQFFYETTGNVSTIIRTVPAGKVLFITDVYFDAATQTEVFVTDENDVVKFIVLKRKNNTGGYEFTSISFGVNPVIIPAGYKLKYQTGNALSNVCVKGYEK